VSYVRRPCLFDFSTVEQREQSGAVQRCIEWCMYSLATVQSQTRFVFFKDDAEDICLTALDLVLIRLEPVHNVATRVRATRTAERSNSMAVCHQFYVYTLAYSRF
jgi:hypothetical protein